MPGCPLQVSGRMSWAGDFPSEPLRAWQAWRAGQKPWSCKPSQNGGLATLASWAVWSQDSYGDLAHGFLSLAGPPLRAPSCQVVVCTHRRSSFSLVRKPT